MSVSRRRAKYGTTWNANAASMPWSIMPAAWAGRTVDVIDEDLGISVSGTRRPGFERLLRALCDGQVGAVFSIEASRLARNGRDWHSLLEFCSVVGTLLIDAEAVYDPRLTNDRLLLGMNRPDSQSTSCSTFSDILQWLVVSTGLRFLTPMAPLIIRPSRRQM
ncbi:MAG: recombinase family protein [Acidobacteriaceae bacterium]